MGFFSSFFNAVEDIGGGFVDALKGGVQAAGQAYNTAAEAVAKPLGVHPDVVKVAAAAFGLYQSAGGGFVDAAGNAVSDAAAADLVAAYGADALVASNQMAAAAELAAATGVALPYAVDPARLASSMAADGYVQEAANLLGVQNGLATSSSAITDTVNSLIASGKYDAALELTMATNPMELGFVNQRIGEAQTAAARAAASAAAPAAVASPVATAPLGAMGAATPFTATDLAALGAESLAVPAATNALAPTAAATAAGANALTPAMVGYGGAGDVLASNALTGAGAGAAGAGLAGYGGAGDVLNPVTGAVTTGADAATGLGAAGAAGAASNALAGYGGAGDVLDPATGAVITGADAAAAGLSASAFDTLAKFARDYGVPLSSLISGITGSQAARDAANVQAESAREARALARQIFDEQKALQEPFRTAGISAQNQLLTLLGLPGGTQGAEFGRYARPFGMQDFQADPGYAFRLSEGMKALEASRAARGGLLSGATGKALSRYGQDLASQEYGNAFNRFQTERVNRLQPLGALMGTGQAAASNQGAAAGQYGQTAGGLTTDIGAARAAGDVGAANAITNALGQYSRYLSNQNIANQIRQSMYGAAIPG